ncbi:hypothetical protein C499_08807 [Halogeometricum borinquense DSM 11551]|uniref:Uncharacterized protein n=1 Tax=Halogeometricum borinquense (strain ATCC 700274 / DSM 11551 / JCM 10706 / KCTC 4070 / PR3) TaxID=469382 RepID=E4NNJ9_HALBP|nr:hypothetical protein Hbor_07550 [Halogeometricum borinquense DSM 11551]ELY27657.1 hypothetical protein C499_08807 [Halogeometricum borinquense DSM 11551]
MTEMGLTLVGISAAFVVPGVVLRRIGVGVYVTGSHPNDG